MKYYAMTFDYRNIPMFLQRRDPHHPHLVYDWSMADEFTYEEISKLCKKSKFIPFQLISDAEICILEVMRS